MSQHASINHLVAATTGWGPNINVPAGKGILIEEIELFSDLSIRFVVSAHWLLKRALSNQERFGK